jgi:hypothetical protein
MMWVLRRSSSSATSLLREHDHFLFQALRVQFGLHVGEAVEDFLALGGEHLRHQFTQGHVFFMEVRRSLIRRASSAPSRSRPALSSFSPG